MIESNYGPIIAGPYAYGDKPPLHLCGWDWERAQDSFEALKDEFIPVVWEGDKRETPGLPIWEYGKMVNGGNHLPTGRQQIGDCVSWGCRQAGQFLHAYERAKQQQEEVFKLWFAPYIYGMSRAMPDTGNGQLGNSDGSTGAWGATAMKKYGILFDDDEGVPSYSGSVAKSWGSPSGPPSRFRETAADNLVKGIGQPIRTVDALREALINYKPCTIASMRGFQMQPREMQGYHVFVPSGSWPHQMCYIAWMDDPFPAAYRLNSWGPGAHGSPLNGEPPGGAWNLADDIAQEFRAQDVECYPLSLFDGFPGEADYGVL